MIGKTISHYLINEKLGEGGMGVVYKAEDIKLERPVALKFLAAHALEDPEHKARFVREAKAAARLDHQNICPIYEIDEADGQTFLAMAFLEGQTLKHKIAERPLKLDEALDIAIQTAQGLKAAHQKEITHRDIKPANLMLTKEAQVKIMDFGLAQLADRSQLTKTTTMLGTPAYMSPEQARGERTDRRTDIWSLGVVIYEMVTGRLPFEGERQEAVVYAIGNEQQEPITALRAGLPMELERIVGKALAKEREERYQHVEEMIVDLRALAEKLKPGRPAALAVPRASAPREEAGSSNAGGRHAVPAAWLPWTVAAIFTLAFAVLAFFHFAEPEAPARQDSRPATRTVVTLPDSALLALGTQYSVVGFDSPALALSPDGRHLVYVGQAEEDTRLYYRNLTRFEDPRPIPGTEEARYAFFSPNSSELGFLTDDRVKKVALDGGAVTTLCRARTPVSAAWIDDTIYFADAQGLRLAGVAATGGEASKLYDSAQRRGRPSAVLPGGRAAIVSIDSEESTSGDYAGIWVVSLVGDEEKRLPITGFGPRYLPSGHLVFGRGGSLLAAPFDVESLELTGEAVPVLDGVALNSIFGQVQAAFSGTGTVAFVPGSDLARGRLAWVDRQGNEGFLGVPERVYGVFNLASDDRRFAVQVADVRDYVWIWSAEAGGRSLAIPASVGSPVWSPDGTALAVRSKTPGEVGSQVVIHDLQSGAAEELLSGGNRARPETWVRPDLIGLSEWGKGVSVVTVRPPGDWRWTREIASGGALGVWGAAVSPDGALIAYASDEGGGRFQVWVEEIDGDDRGQVSTDGGLEPVWCRQCGELFYRQGNRVLASRITRKPRLEVSPPREVFELPDFVDTKGISFRVSSDGERLYYVRRSEPPVIDRIHIVHNWFEELKRLAPAGGKQ